MFRAVLSCVALLAAAASLVLSVQEVRAQQFIRLEGKDLATVLDLGEENHAIGPVAKEVRAMMTMGGNTVITCVAYSPDGKILAVGDGPNRPICTLGGPPPINPNGGLIRLIDTGAGRVRATLAPTKRPNHEYQIDNVWFSRDGARLISYGFRWLWEAGRAIASENLTVWDVATARARAVIPLPFCSPGQIDVDREAASVAVADKDCTLRIWDVGTGGQRLAFRVGTNATSRVNCVKYSPDGRTLAVGTDDGEVTLRDAVSGRTLRSFFCRSPHGHKTRIDLLDFSPDGHYLVVVGRFFTKAGTKPIGSERPATEVKPEDEALALDPMPSSAGPAQSNSELKIFDMIALREVTRPPVGRNENFSWAGFAPESKAVVAVDETIVKIWDAATGTERATFEHGGSSPYHCALSPDGTLLATGEERAIRLVDLVAGKERAILKTWGPIEPPQIAFQPDGKWLTATGYALKTWDLRAALVPEFDEGHTDEVTAIAYAPDGRAIASASEDRTVKIWDIARRKPRLTLRGHEAEVTSVIYTPDGKSVITAGLDRTVRIWDASDGKERAKLLGHTLPIVSAAVSPDGRLVASAGERKDGYVELFTPAEANGHPAVSVAKPAPDFGEVKLWDIATGRLMATPLDSARPIKPEEKGSSAVFGRFEYIAEPPIVTFSPSGSTLAIGRADGSIDLWDIATRRARTLSSATKKDSFSSPDILCLSYSPDGRRLVAGSRDGTIHVWDMSLNHEQPIATLAHSDYVLAVAFSPDGRYVAGTNRNGIINLWSAATWGEAGRVQSQDRGFTSLAFSPDSKSVAGGHRNHDILIYPVDRALHGAR